MEFRPLQVTVNSAENLKNLRHVSTMDVYVVVSLSGDERYKTKQQTPVHEDGGTNPRWGHAFSFTVDEATARTGRLSLEFEIKDSHTLRGHMDVGRVNVPVKELLEQGGGAGDGEPKVMHYSVRLPSGETKGVLEFSYKFGKRFTMATRPSSSSSAAGCPLNAGPSYPQQGYGYPPPGYQGPPEESFTAGLMLGDMMTDAWSHEAGNDGGFHDCFTV